MPGTYLFSASGEAIDGDGDSFARCEFVLFGVLSKQDEKSPRQIAGLRAVQTEDLKWDSPRRELHPSP